MKEEMQKKLFCKIVLVTFWVMDRSFNNLSYLKYSTNTTFSKSLEFEIGHQNINNKHIKKDSIL